MRTRRGNCEGSIYQRSSDGRWLGVACVGVRPSGRPIRRTVSATTRAEVVRKLKVLHREIDDGLVTAERSPTLAVLLERWFEDVLAREIARSTLDNYRSIATHHFIPGLPPVLLTPVVNIMPPDERRKPIRTRPA